MGNNSQALYQQNASGLFPNRYSTYIYIYIITYNINDWVITHKPSTSKMPVDCSPIDAAHTHTHTHTYIYIYIYIYIIIYIYIYIYYYIQHKRLGHNPISAKMLVDCSPINTVYYYSSMHTFMYIHVNICTIYSIHIFNNHVEDPLLTNSSFIVVLTSHAYNTYFLRFLK